MGKEDLLLECWRELPPEAQDQVLQLARSLKPQPEVAHSQEASPSVEFVPQTPLGRKLWEIRQRAIADGMKLLTEEELEQEIAER